jgi:hypothetical protein
MQARSNTGSNAGLQSLDSRESDKGVDLSQKVDEGGSSYPFSRRQLKPLRGYGDWDYPPL